MEERRKEQGHSHSTLEIEDYDSMQLLLHITNEIAATNYSKLIVPVAITQPANDCTEILNVQSDRHQNSSGAPVDHKRLLKYLEAGAVDVLNSPLTKDGVYGLVVHVYRAHKESVKDRAAFLATMRLRKQSWVGIDKEVPYAYLREAM